MGPLRLGVVALFTCFVATLSAQSSNHTNDEESCGSKTCLDIQLVDMYGDGWDGEKFFIETPWQEMFSDAPTCDMNRITHSFCADATGNYPMMLIHENESYTPENYWEVRNCKHYTIFLFDNVV